MTMLTSRRSFGTFASPKCVINKTTDDAIKYGYEDAAPDDVKAKYGYEDASPDDDKAKYGYEDAAPDDDKARYGYEDAAPDGYCSNRRRGRALRRSSMKGSCPERTAQRRRSMGSGLEIQVEIPGKGQVVRRRSINFNESVVVRKVRPTKSLAKHPEGLWYQDDEMKRIRGEISAALDELKRSADLYDEDDSSTGSNHDIRGLEKLLEPEISKVKKYQAWDAVLNEQFLQRHEGEYDDEQLAFVYGSTTRRSSREAQRRASKDAEEIEEYLKSTRQVCRRLSM
jgi:hypothetical protein